MEIRDLTIRDIDNRIEKHGYDKYLYHYTSISTLYSILCSRQFWLGSTSAMNDSKEIRYFIELLQKALLEDIPSDKEDKCREFFKNIFERIDTEYPFAMCFSKLKDDAAQWERYADKAKGVCIVFNIKNVMRAFYEIHFIFGEVYYDFNIKNHRHYEILHDYFATGKLNEFDNEKGQVDNAIACGYCYKHPSFRSEQEIRVISLWNSLPKHAKIETECLRGVIKKFMKVDMEQRCKEAGLSFSDLFEGIIIGPKSSQDIKTLQMFVEEQGIDVLKDKIYKSDCPLR